MVEFLSPRRRLCDYIISPLYTFTSEPRETRVDWLKAIFLVIVFDTHIDFTHSGSSHLLQATEERNSFFFSLSFCSKRFELIFFFSDWI